MNPHLLHASYVVNYPPQGQKRWPHPWRFLTATAFKVKKCLCYEYANENSEDICKPSAFFAWFQLSDNPSKCERNGDEVCIAFKVDKGQSWLNISGCMRQCHFILSYRINSYEREKNHLMLEWLSATLRKVQGLPRVPWWRNLLPHPSRPWTVNIRK